MSESEKPKIDGRALVLRTLYDDKGTSTGIRVLLFTADEFNQLDALTERDQSLTIAAAIRDRRFQEFGKLSLKKMKGRPGNVYALEMSEDKMTIWPTTAKLAGVINCEKIRELFATEQTNTQLARKNKRLQTDSAIDIRMSMTLAEMVETYNKLAYRGKRGSDKIFALEIYHIITTGKKL